MKAELAVPPQEDNLSASPSPAPQPKLTAQQHAILAKVEREADIIQNAAFAASMAGAIPIGNGVGPNGFRFYLDRLLKDAGNPSDPIERMMIEQVALAHQRIAQLHSQSATADTVDASKQYATVAIRLTGEFRRLALALRQYRQPPAKKNFTVVNQQNVSAGEQQVAYLGQSAPSEEQNHKNPFCEPSEQVSKPRLNHAPPQNFLPQPEESGRRSQEQETARAANARGPRAAQTSSFGESSVGKIDGAED